MCGILGCAGSRASAVCGNLQDYAARLRHRGPDDQGVWWSANSQVGLGHCRLSILDLSSAGRQPMLDAEARISLSFNGEIYNYRELRAELRAAGVTFRSQTDTEVVIYSYLQWGVRFLERLNGMFALSLYDQRSGDLLIARDRAGEKPLFYRHANTTLYFASELKALLAMPGMPRQMSLRGLDAYLAYGFVPGDLCLLEGYHKLPPGHALRYSVMTDRLHVFRYWQLPEPAEPGRVIEADLEAELEGLLADAVHRQLVADVPVGILLSGGVDSSLVAALAARARGTIQTFTVGLPGHGSFDERPHAQLVAKHIQSEHHELVAEPVTAELLPTLAEQFDEPIADSSMLPTHLVSRAIRKHATVALGGDGGDELFGGYPHYSFLQRFGPARAAWTGPARRSLGAAAHWLPLGTPGRHHVMGATRDSCEAVAHINLYFDARFRKRLLAPITSAAGVVGCAEQYKRSICFPRHSILQQATRVDFGTYLPNDILTKVDRASMLTSLEVRAPFLDYRVIEFAFSRVPDHLRATAGARKVLLKRIARRLLPKDFDFQRKQGFSLPLHAWMREEWGRYVYGLVKEIPDTIMSRSARDHLIKWQQRNLANEHRLFALAFLELWRRSYQIDPPVAA
jgi:asparagine synthase (glutamine-hydrolysing)